MGQPDLDGARRHHAALRRIFVRPAAGEGELSAGLRSLRLVMDLCRGAAESVDDPYCREKVRLVGEYAAELLVHSEHRRWGRGAQSGVEFLRQQILSALELFQSRLYSLESLRRGARSIESRPAA